MARKPHAVAWEWAREEGPQERPMHSGRGVSPSGLHKKNMSGSVTLDRGVCKAETHIHLFPSGMFKQ